MFSNSSEEFAAWFNQVYPDACRRITADRGHNRVPETLMYSKGEVRWLSGDALGIKVYASPDKMEIHGVIPLELPTIERTSGCLSNRAYSCSVPFSFYLNYGKMKTKVTSSGHY